MSSHTSPSDHQSPPVSSAVRRVHTISASSRLEHNSRASGIPEEYYDDDENYDELVDQDWVGGVGAVGDLHRQSSLPAGFQRGPHGASRSTARRIPSNALNSLSAITGNEGDEEESWEREMPRGLQHGEDGYINRHGDEEEEIIDDLDVDGPSPYSTDLAHSPPSAGTGVRRHQSMTHGPLTRTLSNAAALKRSGTLQIPMRHPNVHQENDLPPSPTNAEEDEDDNTYSDEYFNQSPPFNSYSTSQYGNTSPISRPGQSPWGAPHPVQDWRGAAGSGVLQSAGGSTIDDVQRALSAIELSANNGTMYQNNPGPIGYPPRFNPTTNLNNNNALFSPPPGHLQNTHRSRNGSQSGHSDRSLSGSGPSVWDPTKGLQHRLSNSNINYGYQQRNDSFGSNQQPQQPQPPQPIGGGFQGRHTPVTSHQSNTSLGGGTVPAPPPLPADLTTNPIDIQSLIASKGYNPTNFDIKPSFARYFVIKSYTEDDVHKSLKHEIWSSTDPGNKRLDKAFKECAGRGPLYLFFSVNASGHFCGMAEMLTPVDHTRSSNVWASDKWKGVFEVKWIFVRDIPNATLRHIRLMNTQERKPVTNSRDTQELLPDAGQEMLRIFSTHPARTSLLQDFAFYELQSSQKNLLNQPQAIDLPSDRPSYINTSPGFSHAPVNSQQQPFGVTNALYGSQYQGMTPLMQMPAAQSQYGNVQQNVMRHHSPGPPPPPPKMAPRRQSGATSPPQH